MGAVVVVDADVDAGATGTGADADAVAVCSSAAAARARFKTFAICSCSSRFKWLKSSSTGDAGSGGTDDAATFDERALRTLSIETGLERRVGAIVVDGDGIVADKRSLCRGDV